MSNFEVITNQYEHLLKKEQYIELGKKAGFMIWDELSESYRKLAWQTHTNENYHSFSVIKIGDLPLLTFKRVGKGFKNDLIVNLKTMKSTKNSPKQINFNSETPHEEL
jgi:hypothetical protein